jgi:hypothetical protein
MSTLQHTLQPAFRNRLALVIVLAGAIAALTLALIISANGSSSAGLPAISGHGTPAQQLQAVSGPRYGVQRPTAPASSATKSISPQRQLQAVAGPRYRQPAWILRQR